MEERKRAALGQHKTPYCNHNENLKRAIGNKFFLAPVSMLQDRLSLKLSMLPLIGDLLRDVNQYTLGCKWLENDLAEKALGVLDDTELTMSNSVPLQ